MTRDTPPFRLDMKKAVPVLEKAADDPRLSSELRKRAARTAELSRKLHSAFKPKKVAAP